MHVHSIHASCTHPHSSHTFKYDEVIHWVSQYTENQCYTACALLYKNAAERPLNALSQVSTYMYSKYRAEQFTSFDIHSHGVYRSRQFIGNHEYLSVKRSTGCVQCSCRDLQTICNFSFGLTSLFCSALCCACVCICVYV